MKWSVPKIWDGSDCFIIGGGPSMPRQFGIPEELIGLVTSGCAPPSSYSPYLKPIHDRHVIGVNNAYMLGDWLDVLFFGDCGWYLVHRLSIAKWPKLKVTCCNRFENRKIPSDGIKYLKKNSSHLHGLTSDPSKVSWNGNSGAAAINLAVHLGAGRIILLGFDMDMSGGLSHWHPDHNAKKSPPFHKHLKGFPAITADSEKLGIEIINASPESKIGSLRKVELSEVLGKANGLQDEVKNEQDAPSDS